LFIIRERSRNTGFSCYNVKPLSKNYALPHLPLGIKDSLKEDMRLFDEGRLFDGGFLAEEKVKGKELLRENCLRGIAK
jgi:hypothetical protein